MELRRTQRHWPVRRRINKGAARANAVACRLERPVRPRVFLRPWKYAVAEHRGCSIAKTAWLENALNAEHRQRLCDRNGPHTLTARRSAPARSANHYWLKTCEHFATLPKRRDLQRRHDGHPWRNCANRFSSAAAMTERMHSLRVRRVAASRGA